MTLSLKRLVSLICLCIILLHFSLLFIYSSPLNKQTTKLNFYSTVYSYPFFHQSWSLFAPTPTKKTDLYVRYFTNNKWSSWANILQNEINKHQHNVMAGNETTVLLFSNSLNYVTNSLNDSLYQKPPSNLNFKVLTYSIANYLKNKFHKTTNTKFEILIISKTTKSDQKFYFKNNIIP